MDPTHENLGGDGLSFTPCSVSLIRCSWGASPPSPQVAVDLGSYPLLCPPLLSLPSFSPAGVADAVLCVPVTTPYPPLSPLLWASLLSQGVSLLPSLFSAPFRRSRILLLSKVVANTQPRWERPTNRRAWWKQSAGVHRGWWAVMLSFSEAQPTTTASLLSKRSCPHWHETLPASSVKFLQVCGSVSGLWVLTRGPTCQFPRATVHSLGRLYSKALLCVLLNMLVS